MPRLVPDSSPEARILAGKQRVLERIVQNPEGCWDWNGGTVANGYGALNIRLGTKDDPKVMLYAHRVSYEHHIGSIPDGMEIDHLCHNTRCSNPKHLEVVNHKENISRALALSDDAPCPNGHTGDFHRSGTGQGRKCRQCRRDRRTQKQPSS